MEMCNVGLKREIDNSYNIFIGSGLLNNIPSELKANPIAESYAIITDSNVGKTYGNKILKKIQ